MTQTHLPEPSDLLHGADAIRQFLGLRSNRQIFYLAEQGRLPHFRLGRILCASRASLADWLKAQTERSAVQ